jgi:hypothetical protein
MEPLNLPIEGLNKFRDELIRAFRERAGNMHRQLLRISRVYSTQSGDGDLDDAPGAFVGARLRPRGPLRGSAIALAEPDEELMTVECGSADSPRRHISQA